MGAGDQPLPHSGPADEIAPLPVGESRDTGLKFTRAAALWSSLIVGFLVLIVLLIFIGQNTGSAEFEFLGWQWSLPLGIAILGAAVCGGLLTVAVGTARIYQLRREAKRGIKNRR